MVCLEQTTPKTVCLDFLVFFFLGGGVVFCLFVCCCCFSRTAFLFEDEDWSLLPIDP